MDCHKTKKHAKTQFVLCHARYDETYQNMRLQQDNVETLGEVLEKAHKKTNSYC
jgi:hypothetical protein